MNKSDANFDVLERLAIFDDNIDEGIGLDKNKNQNSKKER